MERDKRVTVEAQLGLIGGTMGLLTGFSILSGVEIIFHLIKLFLNFMRQKRQQKCELKFKNQNLDIPDV